MKFLLLVVLLTLLISGVAIAELDDDEINQLNEEDLPEEARPDAEFSGKSHEEVKVPVAEKPIYKPPRVKGNSYFDEGFDSTQALNKRWVLSEAKKDGAEESISKYDGKWSLEEPKDNPLNGPDLGLVLKSRAKHHAISAKLDRPFDFNGQPLIVQYEVKLQNGQECGGAYIKLLTADPKLNLKQLRDKTPYTIMFGPDKCGQDSKLHFIFRHKNPLNGNFEEKHAKKPSPGFDTFFSDKKTHLFTLIVNPDNSFEVHVDQNMVNSGSLLEDVDPPVNPAKEITDPNDKKPDDWDDREKIPDPDAKKPDDWDELEPEEIEDLEATKPDGWLDDEGELVPDPDAEKPTDWDTDMDGEWEAPQINNPKCTSAPGCGAWKPPKIKNPKYKGKWRAPLIDNPNYKGKWTARTISNPDYFEDKQPYKMSPIAAVGLELWSMGDDILFDNFLITDSKAVADQWAADSWEIKRQQELVASSASGGGLIAGLIDAADKNKWLYVVYAAVMVVPLVLIYVLCWPKKGLVTSQADAAAKRKKTDETSPDAPEDFDADDHETEEAAENTEQKPKPSPEKKTSRTDLENKEGSDSPPSSPASTKSTSPRKATRKAE